MLSRDEGGVGFAGDAEDVKEFVPEGLFIGGLAFRAFPFVREFDGAVADFRPDWAGSGARSRMTSG